MNNYAISLDRLVYNKIALDKVFENFTKKYSLKELEYNESWWNMLKIDNSQNILDTNELLPYLSDYIMVVTMFPKHYVKPHIDKSDNYAAINFPFLNCNNSTVTTFYEHPNNETRYQFRPDYGPTARQLLDTELLNPVYAFSLDDTPVLFHTNKPHSVINNSDSLRVMISWRFKENVSWNDAKQLCLDYKLCSPQ